MTDRIDQMTHEELKSATREIFRAWQASGRTVGNAVGIPLEKAITALEASTIDKLKAILSEDGYGEIKDTDRDCFVKSSFSHVVIEVREIQNGFLKSMIWKKP